MKIHEIRPETEQQKKEIRENFGKFQKELSNASIDDLVNPEVWGILSEKEAKMLRRWVKQFKVANLGIDASKAELIAYPLMNKHLKRAIARAESELVKRRMLKVKNAIVAERKGAENGR